MEIQHANMAQKAYIVSASGRVNLIGEHVDYCGGKVLPAALSFKNTITVRPNGENVIRLTWSTLPDVVELDINNLANYKDEKYAKYQAGSAYIWQQAGHKVLGCDMHFDCRVPFGSGLSSSAAIEVSTIAALCTVAGEPMDKREIALAAQRAENVYVGVNCGIMDQYASAVGKKNHAMLLDCKAVESEYVPAEFGDYRLIIANCNKPHDLITSKYNERRGEVEEALRLLKTRVEIDCLADMTVAQFEEHSDILPPVIRERAFHVVSECERVSRAIKAMSAGDMVELGALLNASHASLRDLYEVTGEELDSLAAAAQAHPDCIGSRMTGAGFGGCTVSLVHKDGVEDFKVYVSERYTKETGYPVTFYDADIDDGITVKEIDA